MRFTKTCVVCVVFRSAYSRRLIRDAGDLIVLLCVVFRPALSSSCSEVQSVPRVLFCAVFWSVYSFSPSFRVKPVVQVSSEKLTQFKCFAAILSSETF